MPFQLLYSRLPKLAQAETRALTVSGADNEYGLPPGQYGFCEMFCDEPGCDCRRVLFYVIASFAEQPQAVIGWGWESAEFYRKWGTSLDESELSHLIGPALNPLSPQSDLAPNILEVMRDVLLQDPAYVDRVQQHYRLFRAQLQPAKAQPRPKGPKNKYGKRRRRK